MPRLADLLARVERVYRSDMERRGGAPSADMLRALADLRATVRTIDTALRALTSAPEPARLVGAAELSPAEHGHSETD